VIVRVIAFCLATAIAGCGPWRPEEPPQTTPDGLELISNVNFKQVYLRPDHDFSVYDSIFISQPEIEFERGWQASQNIADPRRVTNRDIERIKRIMSTEIQNIVTEELVTGTDYKVTENPVAGSLTLKPQIVDLYITAPNAAEPYQVTVLSQSAGKMTIVLEISDTSTKEPLLRITDKAYARDFPDFRQQESVNNRNEGSLALRAWAESLASLLNETRS